MRYVQVAFGAVVSLVALYLAFHGVDFSAVGRAFLEANYYWLAASVALVVLSIVLRAWRWQALFMRSRTLGLGTLFGVLNVGYLVNNVFPFRAGEIVRAVLLGQLEAVGKAEALGTVVVERVVDTLGVILLLGASALLLHAAGITGRPVLVLAALLLLLLLAMILATARRQAALRLVGLFAGFLPERLRAGIVRQAESALEGLAALRDPRASAQVAGLTVIVYLVLVAAMQAQLAAFHLRLPPAGPFFLLGAATLGLVVPASPGSVGVWEGIVIAVLTRIFAVDRSLATSLALVSHVVFFAPPMLLAAVYLWRLGSSWSRVVATAQTSIEIEQA
jgi:glycosyltransferase 2 family protein